MVSISNYSQPFHATDVKPRDLSLSGSLHVHAEHLTESWPLNPLTSISLEYMLNINHGIDTMRWMLAHCEDPIKCASGFQRYIQNKSCFILIPDSLQCDRAFLREPLDAVYVEAAARYLRGESSIIPILADGLWQYPLVGSLEARIRARNWAVGASEASFHYGRLISPADWAGFSRDSKQGRFLLGENDIEPLLVSHEMFPKMPDWMAHVSPCLHLPVEMPRMSYYFGMTVASKANPALKRRYDEAFHYEYSLNVMVSFLGEKSRGRIWYLMDCYMALLRDIIPQIPRIPLDNHRQPKTYLADFSNVMELSNPWRNFERIVLFTQSLFEDEIYAVYTARKLSLGDCGYFIDARSAANLNLTDSESSESSQSSNDCSKVEEIDEGITTADASHFSRQRHCSPQTISMRVSTKKSSRKTTPAQRGQLGSIHRRRRIMPSRKCKRSR